MPSITIEGRSYQTDDIGFLVEADDWTPEFATATAALVGVEAGLTDRHWQIIRYLRGEFEKTGRCPLLYFACTANGLSVAELQALFPAGFLRGACRVAGITYREGYLSNPCGAAGPADCPVEPRERTYRTDVRGFLVNPDQWDTSWARHRAEELGIQGGLTEQHWRVLVYLRAEHATTGKVPTVYDLCSSLCLGVDELSTLFPSGYHRGAVKLAGLRVL